MKRIRFLGAVGVVVTAATLMVAIFTSVNSFKRLQQSSTLSNTVIDTHIIPTAAAAVAAKPGNVTTINIKSGSGVASNAKPLSPAILQLHKGDG